MSTAPHARSRSREGGRSPLRLVEDHGALVAARRGPRDRRGARCPRLGRRRRRVPRDDAPLPRPALHDLGRRSDPEPRDEPEDGQPDHPLRGCAQACCDRERHDRSPAARERLVGRDRHRRAGAERLATRRDHRQGAEARSGREGIRVARQLGRRRRLALRRPEDQASQRADRRQQEGAREGRCPRLRGSPAAAGNAGGQDALLDREADCGQHLQQHDQLLRAAPRHGPDRSSSRTSSSSPWRRTSR